MPIMEVIEVKKIAPAVLFFVLFMMVAAIAPASAVPEKKVEYSIYGFSVGGGTFDLSIKDNAVIFRTITPATQLVKLTLDETMYFSIVKCYTDFEFNRNVWQGTMLTHWEMQIYEHTWFTPNDPCVGTLRGITTLHLTDINAAMLATGTGMQQGSDGTGVMEGVTIHGYEEIYPTTVTMPPKGTFTTLGCTVEGTAIM